MKSDSALTKGGGQEPEGEPSIDAVRIGADGSVA